MLDKSSQRFEVNQIGWRCHIAAESRQWSGTVLDVSVFGTVTVHWLQARWSVFIYRCFFFFFFQCDIKKSQTLRADLQALNTEYSRILKKKRLGGLKTGFVCYSCVRGEKQYNVSKRSVKSVKIRPVTLVIASRTYGMSSLVKPPYYGVQHGW